MKCPYCNDDFEGSFAVACWVWCDNGRLVEACGDSHKLDPGEPGQLAHCGRCDSYFAPPDGYVFRVVQGRPMLVQIG